MVVWQCARCGDDAGGFLRNITSAPPYAANPPGGNLLSNGTTATNREEEDKRGT